MKRKYLLAILTLASLINTTIAYDNTNVQTVPEYTTYDETKTFNQSVNIKSHLEADDSLIVY
jgi:hypothetical protein